MSTLPPWRIPAQMLGGITLAVIGYMILPSSEHLANPDVQPPPEVESKDSFIEEAPSYRLSYDTVQGAWLLTSGDGDVQTLSNIIDAPKEETNQRDFLDREAIRQRLLPIVRNQLPNLSDDERNHLASLRIGAQRLFEPVDLNSPSNAIASIADTKPEKKPEPVKTAPKPAKLPDAFNPGHSTFNKNMRAWGREARDLIKSGSRTLVMKSSSGKYLRISMSKGAVKRIQSKTFGNLKMDKIIYLQYLANENGQKTAIDADFGPGSQKAWKAILNNSKHFQTLVTNLK